MARYGDSPGRFWWLLALAAVLVTALFYLLQDPRIAGVLSVVGFAALYVILLRVENAAREEKEDGSSWSRAARKGRFARRRKRLRGESGATAPGRSANEETSGS